MHEGHQRDAGRVGAERARAHADELEAVRVEQPELEFVPATFGTDGEQDAWLTAVLQDRTRGRPRRRIRHEPNTATEQAIEIVLDEHFEPPVRGDGRQSRVACLLQAFDEQGR